MMQLTPQMRLLVAVQPADFRCGIDGLSRICRQVLDADPMICGGQQYVAALDDASGIPPDRPIRPQTRLVAAT
jgi:hypothetical protein